VVSRRAGSSEESPVGSGPGADCGFATPRRKASSGPNAVERIIVHIGPTVRPDHLDPSTLQRDQKE
jgi:hypothetical protein